MSAPPPRSPSLPRKKHVWRTVAMLILLGLAVHLLLPQLANLNRSLAVLRSMALWAVALALAMQVLSYVSQGYLLVTLANVTGQRLSVWRGTLIATASYSVGLVAAGMVAGAAAAYRWLRGSGASAEGAALGGWLPSLFYNGALVAVSILGVALLLAAHDITRLQLYSFGFILLVLDLIVLGILWGMRHRDRLTGWATRLAARWAALRHRPYDPVPIQAQARRLYDAWDVLRTGNWRWPALGAVCDMGFDILTLYFLFVAAGYPIGAEVLLAGYGLPLLLSRLPILPGGLGIVEATMTALYNGLGVPTPVTVVVVLTYRFVSFWLPVLTGFPLVPYLERVAGHIKQPVPADS